MAIRNGTWVCIEEGGTDDDGNDYSNIVCFVPEEEDSRLDRNGAIRRQSIRVSANTMCVNNGGLGYVDHGPDNPNGAREDYDMLSGWIPRDRMNAMGRPFQRFANQLLQHNACFWVHWFNGGHGLQNLIEDCEITSVDELVQQYRPGSRRDFIDWLVARKVAGPHNAELIADAIARAARGESGSDLERNLSADIERVRSLNSDGY